MWAVRNIAINCTDTPSRLLNASRVSMTDFKSLVNFSILPSWPEVELRCRRCACAHSAEKWVSYSRIVASGNNLLSLATPIFIRLEICFLTGPCWPVKMEWNIIAAARVVILVGSDADDILYRRSRPFGRGGTVE